MFEPGWILIGFIEDRLGDPKQFDPARLKPIPIFYGTPNFPIIIVQTLNSSPSQTSMAATNMFEPGWILIGFIEDRLGDTKQFNPARLKPIPIFYGTPNFPIFYCSDNKFFSISNFHGGYKYVWAGLNPDWNVSLINRLFEILIQFHWARTQTIQFPFSMGRQTSLYSIIRQ